MISTAIDCQSIAGCQLFTRLNVGGLSGARPAANQLAPTWLCSCSWRVCQSLVGLKLSVSVDSWELGGGVEWPDDTVNWQICRQCTSPACHTVLNMTLPIYVVSI